MRFINTSLFASGLLLTGEPVLVSAKTPSESDSYCSTYRESVLRKLQSLDYDFYRLKRVFIKYKNKCLSDYKQVVEFLQALSAKFSEASFQMKILTLPRYPKPRVDHST
jgi:hypothetical protein